MDDSLLSFIARMKLAELQGYREKLHAEYDRIEADAEQAATNPSTPGEGQRQRLAALYEGLRKLEIGGKKIHPDLANLDVVLSNLTGSSDGGSWADHGSPSQSSADLVTLWLRRLGDAVRKGRARADVTTLFGGLVGETLDASRATHCPPNGFCENAQATLTRADSNPVDLSTLLGPLEASLGDDLSLMRQHISDLCATVMDEGFSRQATRSAVVTLSQDRRLPASVRQRFQKMLELDPETSREALELTELKSAVRLRWSELTTWDHRHPAWLVPQWTRNRWRAFPVFDLEDRLHVELATEVLFTLLSTITGAARVNRVLRLRRLMELNAPDVIIDNERRVTANTFDLGQMTTPFYWSKSRCDKAVERLEDGESSGPYRVRARRILAEFDAAGPIARRRMMVTREVVGTSLDGDYADDPYGSATGIALAFAAVNAELRLVEELEAAQNESETGPPVAVLKSDLKDFFPSLNHDLIAGLLQWIGVDDTLVQLFRRLLQVPLAVNNASEPTRTVRGLPLGLGFSRVLARLVMTVLVGSIRCVADVRVLNLVDDIVIMGLRPEVEKAWQELQRFVKVADLSINLEKTGSICIASGHEEEDAHNTLPEGPVVWGMLELGEDGVWRVSDDEVESFIATSQERIEAHDALLDRVKIYREQLMYLLTWLAPQAPMGTDHMAQVKSTVMRFHRTVLKDRHANREYPGVLAMLRSELQRRFLQDRPASIPDGWFHWPLTAGGMALPHIGCEVVPLQKALQKAREEGPSWPPEVEESPDSARAEMESPKPQGLELDNETWAVAFEHLHTLLTPAKPEELKSASALIEQFMKRGSRVLGRKQEDLAPVWLWIIATFGPQILDHFGSYDFLDTDLVPTQLLLPQ